MGGRDIFKVLGNFMQGVSVGMLKRHVEEQAADREIKQGIKKFEKVEELLKSDPRFEDPEKKKTLFALMGIPMKQESEAVEILRQLNVQRGAIGLKKDEAELAGTTPSQTLAKDRFRLEQERFAQAKKDKEAAANRAQAKTQLTLNIGAVDKELSSLEALYKKWQDPLAGKIKQQLKSRYGDFDTYYLQKRQQLLQKREQLSAAGVKAAQQTPLEPTAGDAQIPESQDDDELFQQLGY